MTTAYISETARFAQYVGEPTTGGCLPWVGSTNDRGYARYTIRDADGVAKRPAYAHRVAWEMANGPIPEGLTVDHLCAVIACVNPAHMELVTKGENTARRWRRWREARAA